MPLLLNLLPARFLLTLREWFDYKISHCVLAQCKKMGSKHVYMFPCLPPHQKETWWSVRLAQIVQCGRPTIHIIQMFALNVCSTQNIIQQNIIQQLHHMSSVNVFNCMIAISYHCWELIVRLQPIIRSIVMIWWLYCNRYILIYNCWRR